jgi:hypothetical protein
MEGTRTMSEGPNVVNPDASKGVAGSDTLDDRHKGDDTRTSGSTDPSGIAGTGFVGATPPGAADDAGVNVGVPGVIDTEPRRDAVGGASEQE